MRNSRIHTNKTLAIAFGDNKAEKHVATLLYQSVYELNWTQSFGIFQGYSGRKTNYQLASLEEMNEIFTQLDCQCNC